ncbi:MAG: hypothetical protein ABR588_11320 [Sphingomicrobium sp.]|nr:hypothetical protein [Sphingomonadales bacterium]
MGPLRRRAVLAGGAGLVASAVAAPLVSAPGESAAYDRPGPMYEAVERQPAETLAVGEAHIRVVFADGAPGLDRARTIRWIRGAAAALTRYFGRFPVANYALLVIATDGNRVGHATTFGFRGSATRITVGRETDEGFARDWVLVHEMLHAALPDLPRRALWLQEGNATWIEPVARVQAGQLPAAEMWRQALLGMARGQPAANDSGMDGTKAWNRLYWGGATFWLLAEIAIHQASNGRAALRDAMRAINRASGGNTADWSPERMMAAGDPATGTASLLPLYRRFADEPYERIYSRCSAALEFSSTSRARSASTSARRWPRCGGRLRVPAPEAHSGRCACRWPGRSHRASRGASSAL